MSRELKMGFIEVANRSMIMTIYSLVPRFKRAALAGGVEQQHVMNVPAVHIFFTQ